MTNRHIEDIRKIAFTKLRKLEVYRLYNDVVDVIERFDTKALHLGDTCEVLIGMKPKADKLVLTEQYKGPHSLTPKLKQLQQRRLKFAAIITNHMRTVEKADLEGTSHLVTLAKPIVVFYLHYLRKRDQVGVDVFIKGFFHELELNPAIKDALYKLRFKAYMDELEKANNEAEETLMARGEDLSKRRGRGNTLSEQRDLQYILSILFNQVNHHQQLFKDLDYSKLTTALNRTIANYTKLIKTRDTHKKNRIQKAEEAQTVALEEKKNLAKIDTEKPVTTIATDSQKENIAKPSTTAKKQKGNNQPVNGLMDILKNPDKGKTQDGKGDK